MFFQCLHIFPQYTKISIMAEQAEWSIVFYTTTDGTEPVRAFLQSLDPLLIAEVSQ